MYPKGSLFTNRNQFSNKSDNNYILSYKLTAFNVDPVIYRALVHGHCRYCDRLGEGTCSSERLLVATQISTTLR